MNVEISKDKLEWLESITLGSGSHEAFADGVCALEAVAYLAHEPHSDAPKCASPVIAAFVRRWNDDLDDAGRQKLKPYLARLIGTKASPEVEDARAWLAADWMVRHHTPAWLDLAGCGDQAKALRDLPKITEVTCKAAAQAIADARQRAEAAGKAAGNAAGNAAWDAAWDAAGNAAGNAAWNAAWAAAGNAAWDAARAAAGNAAGNAAWAAARAAAGNAARKKLEPTKLSLQASAFQLLEKMIELQA
jgi:hypothetical protein